MDKNPFNEPFPDAAIMKVMPAIQLSKLIFNNVVILQQFQRNKKCNLVAYTYSKV